MKYTLTENQSPWLEDLYLEHFGYRTHGFFVEVGVGHSFYQTYHGEAKAGTLCGSNTGSLADLGWTGIYIEPHPLYYQEAVERHKKNVVRLANFAAGAETKKCLLGLGDTLRHDVQENFGRLGWLDSKIEKADYPDGVFEVEERNINDILEDYSCPKTFDLLSVDVEGYEKIIFGAFDFDKYKPKMVVVEVRTQDMRFDEIFRTESQEVENIIMGAGYDKVYCDMLNAVFVRSEE